MAADGTTTIRATFGFHDLFERMPYSGSGGGAVRRVI
jgi:hypothetical protein